MQMRLKKGWEVGDAGAVYEYDIKLPKISGVDMTNDEFEREAQASIRKFVASLRRQYKWIGDVYQTGRSGGWLAIEDKTGHATESSTRTIMTKIAYAMRKFIDHLQAKYPA